MSKNIGCRIVTGHSRPEQAEELADKADAVLKKEAGIMETMEKEGTYSRPWVDEKLQELDCEYITN